MISHLYPGPAFENPNHGIFIKNQLKEIRKFVDIVLYVPVDLTPSMGTLRKQKGIKRKIVCIRDHFKRTILTKLSNINHPVYGEYVRHFSIPPKSMFPFFIGLSQFLSLVRKVSKNNHFDAVFGGVVGKISGDIRCTMGGNNSDYRVYAKTFKLVYAGLHCWQIAV